MKYPGALLLDEIEKLPNEDKEKINYTAICSMIAKEIMARTVRQNIRDITEHQGELDG